MANPRIPVHCKSCGFLMIEIEDGPDNTRIIHSHEVRLQLPDPDLWAAGVAIAGCVLCGGKTEFPTKDLPW